MNLDKLNDDELIDLYPKLLDQLKIRGIIRTKNIIGEFGEYFARREYKNNPKLPELQLNLQMRGLSMLGNMGNQMMIYVKIDGLKKLD